MIQHPPPPPTIIMPILIGITITITMKKSNITSLSPTRTLNPPPLDDFDGSNGNGDNTM